MAVHSLRSEYVGLPHAADQVRCEANLHALRRTLLLNSKQHIIIIERAGMSDRSEQSPERPNFHTVTEIDLVNAIAEIVCKSKKAYGYVVEHFWT